MPTIIQKERPSLQQLFEQHAKLEAEEERILDERILDEPSRVIPIIPSATHDRDHLWQAYNFPDKSGGTLGIYLQGLGSMNQMLIDKLLRKIFSEAGESMAWPAFQAHTKIEARHAAVEATPQGVPVLIEWRRASITYIVQPADFVQQAQPPEQPTMPVDCSSASLQSTGERSNSDEITLANDQQNGGVQGEEGTADDTANTIYKVFGSGADRRAKD
jgi:hypothetical protein